jgi:hypothetical protein
MVLFFGPIGPPELVGSVEMFFSRDVNHKVLIVV